MTDPSRKDEVLNQIVRLEASLDQQKAQYQEEKSKISKLEEVRDNYRKAYDEIKELLDKANSEFNQYSLSLDSLARRGKSDALSLEQLKRELSRILDAEKINQEYQALVEQFKERCLDAPWRKENRSDGMGALEHQIGGAIHLAVAKQALLGDKRGLGKSLTSIIWLDLIEAQRVIVICPSDTMDNFMREIELWAPHRTRIKLGKMGKSERDFLLPGLKSIPQFILVLNYEAWRKDPRLINDLVALKPDTLILDEAHRAKTWDTTTCRGIINLRFGFNECPSCNDPQVSVNQSFKNLAKCQCGHESELTEFCSIKHVLPMTGTPILNRPQELFPQLRLIDPKNFTTENNYLKDFCYKSSNNRWTWQYGGEKKIVEKIGPRFLARDRKEAGVIIPPQTPVDHTITLEELEENYPKQYKAYRQAREYGQIVLDPDRQIAMSMPVFITVLLRLRQILVWPAAIELKVFNPDTQEDEVFAKLDVHESAKLDKAEELIREITEEGDRVALFSQFKPGMHVLANRLGPRAIVYDGDTSSYMRNQIQLDFDPKTAPKNPQWDVVLCNYKSAGEGLNLHTATHLIMLDLEWNPGKEDQAAGRIDRMGQTRETTLHKILVEPSVDKWMQTLIEEKRELIGGFESQAGLMQKAYDALRNGEM